MITIYLAAFPMDSWGYFGTYEAATEWMDKFRDHKESLYDLPPKNDGGYITRLEFDNLNAFCQEVNGSIHAFWSPPT